MKGFPRWLLLGAAALLLPAACSQNYSPKPVDEALSEKGLTPLRAAPASSGQSAEAERLTVPGYSVEGDELKLRGMTARVPSGWERREPSSSMRVAEFALKATGAGGEASLAVFQGPMGSVDDNVNRWIGQFEMSGESRRWEVSVDAGRTQVTMVGISGTFTGSMGQGSGQQTGYRLLGAIIGQGSYYFKLLGPEATVTAWEASFEEFISSISTG